MVGYRSIKMLFDFGGKGLIWLTLDDFRGMNPMVLEHAENTDMKNYLKFLSVLALAVSMLFPSTTALAAEESPFNIYMYVVRGSIRTQAIDPTYDSWSHAAAMELYTNMTLTNKDVGFRLLTEHITQPSVVADRTNNTIHYVVRIVGKNGAKVSLSMLKLTQRSSDPNNTLANSYSLADVPNLSYSPRALGITYGPGGPRTSDIIDNVGPGDALKDEVVAVLLQGRYYTYNNPANYAQVENYVTNFIVGYELTGTCEIVGHVNAIARRTLQARGMPIPPTLSIANHNNGSSLGINMESGRTAILYSRPNPRFGEWSIESTMNAGDLIHRSTGGSMKCYKAILQ